MYMYIKEGFSFPKQGMPGRLNNKHSGNAKGNTSLLLKGDIHPQPLTQLMAPGVTSVTSLPLGSWVELLRSSLLTAHVLHPPQVPQCPALHLLALPYPKVFRVVPEVQQLLCDCFPIFLPFTLAEDYLQEIPHPANDRHVGELFFCKDFGTLQERVKASQTVLDYWEFSVSMRCAQLDTNILIRIARSLF